MGYTYFKKVTNKDKYLKNRTQSCFVLFFNKNYERYANKQECVNANVGFSKDFKVAM